MLKNVDLFDFKEKLKDKYGYDENLAETTSIMAQAIQEYLGEEYEEVVLNAVESCKVVVADGFKPGSTIYENVYDVLVREGMDDFAEGAIVGVDQIKLSAGLYHSVPRISHDGSEFHLDGVDRIIVLSNTFNSEHPVSKGTFGHELMHLAKAYLKEFSIEGDTLIQRSGFKMQMQKLSIHDGKVKRTVIKEVGVGLEEGVNYFDEECLIAEHFCDGYKSQGGVPKNVAEVLVREDMHLKEEIRRAEMTKDDVALRQVFDENMGVGYDGFIAMLDDIIRLDYQRYKSMFDPKNLAASTQELVRYANEVLAPQIKSLRDKLVRGAELTDGYTKSA